MEPADPLEQFSGRKYIAVESYKKDGTPKVTAVQSIEDAGMVWFRTDPGTWKVRRIRRDPHVRIALSDRSGKPTAAWVDGDAQVVEGEESDRMQKVFRKEYGAIGSALVDRVAKMRGEKLTAVVSVKLRPREGLGTK
jgi:uncharacterized protein